ncbi:MAG TPA: penicillin acylase family protein [Gaiellaceae bacterium]|nr:penicillin acylase family protein [Gaiellaceae bacterium]
MGLRAGGLGVCALVAALVVAATPAARKSDYAAVAYNILPPGESGNGGAHRNDQAKLYDALTPLRGKVTAKTLKHLFKPETLGPVGKTKVERTPRAGVRIVRDAWDVAHVYGRTSADTEWGAGWVTAEDRWLILQLIRGPGREVALDGPPHDQSHELVPSKATEAALAKQFTLAKSLGKKGREIIEDIDAYTAGINAYLKAYQPNVKRWMRNDTIAAAAVLAGQFGVGGGDEARRAELLAELQNKLGAAKGREVWDDLREQQDPETPVTATRSFPYGKSTSNAGNVQLDAGSLSPSVERAGAAAEASRGNMSNALLVTARRSTTRHPILVAGPQVGYFYPGFFLELDLHGGGFNARGVMFPGVPWIVIGRGPDYAWSATSSDSDIVDQYVETLCGGDDTHYLYKGVCRAMGTFVAGVVKGPPDIELSFRSTVHGPVLGYATVGGKKVAISSKRSTHGREILSARAFEDLDKGRVHSAKQFVSTMGQMEFAFNWVYADNRDIAYYSSGRLPIRPPGVDLGLPTNGDGDYEWRGFLSQKAHPQAIDPPGGVLVNWNNKPAPGFAAADDRWSYGPLQRVQLLDDALEGTGKYSPAAVVAAMNTAATQDFRVMKVLPSISLVLAGSTAPSPRDQQMLDLLESWRAAGGSRLDLDLDGKIDNPGAAIMDAAWPRIARAILSPVLGPALPDLEALVPLDDPANANGSAYESGWYGYVDKDLRRLMARAVKGPLKVAYCGGGDVDACRASLWTAIDEAGNELQAAQGPDPTTWRADATGERIRFSGGLLQDTMRWTNRPTFQQVISFARHRPR